MPLPTCGKCRYGVAVELKEATHDRNQDFDAPFQCFANPPQWADNSRRPGVEAHDPACRFFEPRPDAIAVANASIKAGA